VVEINPIPDARGGTLLSFNVQMSSGGDFMNISESLATKITVKEGIQKGQIYSFRY